MSIYRELRCGPVRATSTRRMRNDSIYMRLSSYRDSRCRDRDRIIYYGGRRDERRSGRRRRRACSRDRQFEKEKLDTDERKKVEDLEKEVEEEEEKHRAEESDIEVIKKDVLMVEDQDFHIKENGMEHNTDMYDCVGGKKDPQAVVRRGQEFKLTLTFQRPWDGKVDDMFLIFKLGENACKGKGTYIKIKVEEGNDTSYKEGRFKKWGARILQQSGNNLTVAVFSPPNAIIGEWEFAIRTVKEEEPKKKVYQSVGKDDILIVLNPYCRDDQVYMENQEWKKEYVENEYGMVFYGTSKSIGAKSWMYGQFSRGVVEISMHLLRKAFNYQISQKMSNPVEISRALSRILNDCDDNGVLSGNWSGNYKGGAPPLSWKGSVPILEQYFNGKEPVKFGQCWVFSHVLTTVSRALGLPCRSVTNFSSAHDTNLSMTIDKYVDDDGDIIASRTADSVWNFHVWNEVWMNRPDLDKLLQADGKYDGWHAIDATPQEQSEYLFQCGPSPLSAIRNGEMHVGYDTKFIFAEVNAEVCHWRDDGDDPTLISHISNSVGKCISTKAPTGKQMTKCLFGWDSSDRLDVTNLYKHPEGSVAEREAVERALDGGDVVKAIFENPTGVNIVVLPLSPPKVGEDFTVSIHVQNKADVKRSVRVTTNARPMTYWGDVIGTRKIASNVFSEVALEPLESRTFEMDIESERYMSECDAQLAIAVLAMGTIRGFPDHESKVYASEDIQVQGPKMVVKGPGEATKAGHPVTIQLEFTNPLSLELTNCVLSVEGSVKLDEGEGFEKKYCVFRKKIENIKPKETRKIQFKVKPLARPKRTKEREVEVGIACDQLPEIEGNCDIQLLR